MTGIAPLRIHVVYQIADVGFGQVCKYWHWVKRRVKVLNFVVSKFDLASNVLDAKFLVERTVQGRDQRSQT